MSLFKVVFTSILMIIQSLVLNHIGYGLSSIEYWIIILSTCMYGFIYGFWERGALDG